MKQYCYEHPHPAITADIILFNVEKDSIEILLIQRKNEPYKDYWAFPGGFMDIDETIEACAHRELQEETGLEHMELHEVGCFSEVGRDPRERVVSIAFYGVVDKSSVCPRAGDDARNTGWFNISNLPPLAFDHKEMLGKAMTQLSRDKK